MTEFGTASHDWQETKTAGLSRCFRCGKHVWARGKASHAGKHQREDARHGVELGERVARAVAGYIEVFDLHGAIDHQIREAGGSWASVEETARAVAREYFPRAVEARKSLGMSEPVMSEG